MRAWFSCTGAELLDRQVADTVGRLSSSQASRGFAGTPQQEEAWQREVSLLRDAIRVVGGQAWTVALEYDLLRLEERVDAVVITDRAILVMEFKTSDASRQAVAEAEDYALDLRDFHAGSGAHPVVPVLVTDIVPAALPGAIPDQWRGVLPPIRCGGDGLPALINWVQTHAPVPDVPLSGAAWLSAAYRPVPTIVDAATMLYTRNSVADIAASRADVTSLTRTTTAIAREVEAARQAEAKVVVFVTGIPGAGKTLCGLNAVFGDARLHGSAFLTGNAPLVNVLREALARDAVARGRRRRAEADRLVKTAIQNVHRFLEDCALDPMRLPPERLIVFDEAQRAWDEAKARRGTQNRPGRLTLSEPAHTLEIMGRRPGFAVVVALVGGGQEINTGEAGLAEWGRAIEANSGWTAVAAPRALSSSDPMQRLADGPRSWLALDSELDLAVAVRSVRESCGAEWVDAVLANNPDRARELAALATALPFFLTRDLDALRDALRALTRGRRRSGLVRSSGAKRLRAAGLAAEVAAEEVADWFLNRWPDPRASEALESAATEYACQGLELDVVGVAWGGDFIRGTEGWMARRFAGAKWQREVREAHFVLNTYRVLLTRARYETVIWVPSGSSKESAYYDATNASEQMDAVAQFLIECGVRQI